MSSARRSAEEALAKYDVVYNEAYWDNGRTPRCYADHCADALRALLAEPAPAPDAVREAAERLRGDIRRDAVHPRYHRPPWREPGCVECSAVALLAALDARPGGERGGE